MALRKAKRLRAFEPLYIVGQRIKDQLTAVIRFWGPRGKGVPGSQS